MAELPANVAAEVTQRLASLGAVLPMAIELLAESYEKQLRLLR
jgi:hypothetical protein